jgi:hypothetical protein
VIQIQPFHCSTIQDVMVDTPKSHKYRYALEYITCLHHIILDSSVPGQPAAATWRCGSGHGAVPWRVVGVCGGGLRATCCAAVGRRGAHRPARAGAREPSPAYHMPAGRSRSCRLSPFLLYLGGCGSTSSNIRVTLRYYRFF